MKIIEEIFLDLNAEIEVLENPNLKSLLPDIEIKRIEKLKNEREQIANDLKENTQKIAAQVQNVKNQVSHFMELLDVFLDSDDGEDLNAHFFLMNLKKSQISSGIVVHKGGNFEEIRGEKRKNKTICMRIFQSLLTELEKKPPRNFIELNKVVRETSQALLPNLSELQ